MFQSGRVAACRPLGAGAAQARGATVLRTVASARRASAPRISACGGAIGDLTFEKLMFFCSSLFCG